MMRLLVNENVTRTVIEELRRRGHDVLSAKESMRAESDDVILARAQAERRIVVTHDKDFGELGSDGDCLHRAESSCFDSAAPTRTPTIVGFSKRWRAARTGPGTFRS